MLSLGPEAPWWVDDSSQFLGPFNTRQAEIGAKYAPNQRILLSAAIFSTCAQPFFYPKRDSDSRQCFARPARSLESRRLVLRVRRAARRTTDSN